MAGARESLHEFSIASRIVWFSFPKCVSDAFMDMLAVNCELFCLPRKDSLEDSSDAGVDVCS